MFPALIVRSVTNRVCRQQGTSAEQLLVRWECLLASQLICEGYTLIWPGAGYIFVESSFFFFPTYLCLVLWLDYRVDGATQLPLWCCVGSADSYTPRLKEKPYIGALAGLRSWKFEVFVGWGKKKQKEEEKRRNFKTLSLESLKAFFVMAWLHSKPLVYTLFIHYVVGLGWLKHPAIRRATKGLKECHNKDGGRVWNSKTSIMLEKN